MLPLEERHDLVLVGQALDGQRDADAPGGGGAPVAVKGQVLKARGGGRRGGGNVGGLVDQGGDARLFGCVVLWCDGLGQSVRMYPFLKYPYVKQHPASIYLYIHTR